MIVHLLKTVIASDAEKYRVPFTFTAQGVAYVYANSAVEAENKVTQILDDEGLDGLLEMKVTSQRAGATYAEKT